VATSPQNKPEIREDNWTGTDFVYPGCRVAINSLSPIGDGECRPLMWEVAFSVLCYAEGSSSKAAANLAGIVEKYLIGRRIKYPSDIPIVIPVTRINVPPNGVIPPVPENERLWRAENQFVAQVKDASG